MKVYTLYFCLFFLSIAYTTRLHAQEENIVKSLERNVAGEGRVTIYQDPRIATLLGNPRGLKTSDGTIKMAGYRVQVYSGGNTRNSKQEAESIASRVKSGFPELKIHTMFNPPRWLCQVGDFLSIEEADAMMRKLRRDGGFKEAIIVKEQVSIPL